MLLDGQSHSSIKGGTVAASGISVRPASPLRSPSATVRIPRSQSTNGKSSHRRVSTVFDPPDEGQSQSQIRDAELYRARMQALRSDMGDGWLKVFSQSQTPSPGVAAG
jgi:hypothetical protein